ncbi:MAG: hypothetical protein WAY02_09395 [Burkholderiaceae bacterium]
MNGLTATPDGHDLQTLVCTEYPPASRQNKFPHGYVVPTRQIVRRWPGAWRSIEPEEVRIRIVISEFTDMAAVTKIYDAWVLAAINAFDETLTLEGACDYVGEQSCGPLTLFDEDGAWGFEVAFEGFRVSAADTFAG